MATDEQNIYRGFSTIGTKVTKDWTLYDIQLIERDLLNHFMTRVGERVMRPNWGCRIWDYIMEPLTHGMVELISDEAIRICEEDGRVTVQNVEVFTMANGVRVQITLLYDQFNVNRNLLVNFEQRQAGGY